MKNKINNLLNSIGQRKILFILGDHLKGKTFEVKKFLIDKHKECNYVDVGLYIQSKITEERLKIYEIYPKEFIEDAEEFFKELVNEKYKNTNLMVFDHMEFLLSEGYNGWIKILDKKTIKDNIAIIIIPSEYRDRVPLNAYRYIEI